jgi:membrane-bound serine protease (ClpP class)
MRWELVIGLILAGAILMGMEVYIFGFVLGTIGAVMQLVAVVMCARELEWHQTAFLVAAIVVLDGAVVVAAIRFFPKTKLGKKMILEHTQQVYKPAIGDPLQELVGREGVAESLLRPTGTALVEGRRVDVVTEGEFLERGTKVRVQAVKEGRLVVKKLS